MASKWRGIYIMHMHTCMGTTRHFHVVFDVRVLDLNQCLIRNSRWENKANKRCQFGSAIFILQSTDMVIWLVFSKHYSTGLRNYRSTGLRNYKKICKSLPIFGRMPTVDNIYTKYTRVAVIILLVLVHCVFVLILSGARHISARY